MRRMVCLTSGGIRFTIPPYPSYIFYNLTKPGRVCTLFCTPFPNILLPSMNEAFLIRMMEGKSIEQIHQRTGWEFGDGLNSLVFKANL
jgi:hypothetical protein